MKSGDTEKLNLSCGLPFDQPSRILLAHGGGGRMMNTLINDLIKKYFKSDYLATGHDSAVVPSQQGFLAFTTDSYVVRPLFFPGGDIGKLAVFGTVNDLAMSGAKPRYLSVAMILEEGFPIESLEQILISMRQAAEQCGVQIVTGDTKVVENGKGDGIFLNTTGIGEIHHSYVIQPSSIRSGDAIIVTGDLGRHGIAIMAAREGLEFETTVLSDCAPLAGMVLDLIESGVEVHCLRDLTRGGLASALNEIATVSGCFIEVEEGPIPILAEVRGACEMLGLDPLYVANEGRMVAFVPLEQVSQAIAVMHRHEAGQGAAAIGTVLHRGSIPVSIKSRMGVSRVLDLLSGEQLPRIC